ncbi:hypothetical protein [Streptomyces sp. NBC_01518]
MTNRQHHQHGTGVKQGAGAAASRTRTSEPPTHALLFEAEH